MERQPIRVLIETNGDIPNYRRHVAQPLALIIAQAFTYLIQPTERILPEHIEVEHHSNIALEEGTLVAVSISTGYGDEDIPSREALEEEIAQSIYNSGMFRCRKTHGTVRLELQLNVPIRAAETA